MQITATAPLSPCFQSPRWRPTRLSKHNTDNVVDIMLGESTDEGVFVGPDVVPGSGAHSGNPRSGEQGDPLQGTRSEPELRCVQLLNFC